MQENFLAAGAPPWTPLRVQGGAPAAKKGTKWRSHTPSWWGGGWLFPPRELHPALCPFGLARPEIGGLAPPNMMGLIRLWTTTSVTLSTASHRAGQPSKAKFHYTDTDTGPTRTRTRTFLRRNGPARTQRSFAAKKSLSVSVSVSV